MTASYDRDVKTWKMDRIISVATLATSLVALVLVLKRPAPVAAPQTQAQIKANAQSFQEKLALLEQTKPGPSTTPAPTPVSQPALTPEPAPAAEPATQVHITSDEVTAAITQAAKVLPAGAPISPNTDLGSMPAILDQQVSFDGDVVHGQFLTNLGGKNVWVTVSGHLGSKDGFATFDPTEFKVGDLNVPVGLVNDTLQKRLTQERERLKLPNGVSGMKVQDGELVLSQ